MLSSYNTLTKDEKLALLRAFFSLKQNDDFKTLVEFLTALDEQVARNLRTLPVDRLQIEQGKAQLLNDLFELIEMAREEHIRPLMTNTA